MEQNRSIAQKIEPIKDLKKKLDKNIVSLRKQKRDQKVYISRIKNQQSNSVIYQVFQQIQNLNDQSFSLKQPLEQNYQEMQVLFQQQISQKSCLSIYKTQFGGNSKIHEILDLKADLKIFEEAASYMLKNSHLDINDIIFLMKLLIHQNPLVRFCSASCIHYIIRFQFINNKQNFLDLFNNNEGEFIDCLISVLFQEDYLYIKSVLAETVCDIIKLSDRDIFNIIVNKGNFIELSLQIFEMIINQNLILIFGNEIQKLLYCLVWGLGILCSEDEEHSIKFIFFDGVKILLNLAIKYSTEIDGFEDQLESVITNAISNVCPLAEKNFEVFKDTIPYFLNVIYNQKSEYFMEMSDAVMGLELVMQAGGRDAIDYFLNYEFIDQLLQRTILMIQDNLKQLRDHFSIYQETDEGILHLVYPSLNMLQRLLLNSLDDRLDLTSVKLVKFGFLQMIEDSLQIQISVSQHQYWKEQFKQLICLIYSFVASGNYAIQSILTHTNIINTIFKFLIINRSDHKYEISNGIIREFSNLLVNLINEGDDWCYETLVSMNIVGCILNLICDVRYGFQVCVDALECLEQILTIYQEMDGRYLEVQNLIQESIDPISKQQGLEILQCLSLESNENIREQALNILENYLDFDLDMMYQEMGNNSNSQMSNNFFNQDKNFYDYKLQNEPVSSFSETRQHIENGKQIFQI